METRGFTPFDSLFPQEPFCPGGSLAVFLSSPVTILVPVITEHVTPGPSPLLVFREKPILLEGVPFQQRNERFLHSRWSWAFQRVSEIGSTEKKSSDVSLHLAC